MHSVLDDVMSQIEFTTFGIEAPTVEETKLIAIPNNLFTLNQGKVMGGTSLINCPLMKVESRPF